jgi:hypothetical protein
MMSAGLRFCRSVGNSLDHRHIVAYCAILLSIEVCGFLFLARVLTA